MTQDLRALFNIDQIESDASINRGLIEAYEYEEVSLSSDNAEDRPMMLRLALHNLFNEAGLDFEECVGKNLDVLDGETPYCLAFQSSNGLEKAIKAMIKVYNLDC